MNANLRCHADNIGSILTIFLTPNISFNPLISYIYKSSLHFDPYHLFPFYSVSKYSLIPKNNFIIRTNNQQMRKYSRYQ